MFITNMDHPVIYRVHNKPSCGFSQKTKRARNAYLQLYSLYFLLHFMPPTKHFNKCYILNKIYTIFYYYKCHYGHTDIIMGVILQINILHKIITMSETTNIYLTLHIADCKQHFKIITTKNFSYVQFKHS